LVEYLGWLFQLIFGKLNKEKNNRTEQQYRKYINQYRCNPCPCIRTRVEGKIFNDYKNQEEVEF
jgi:hypothetical protein